MFTTINDVKAAILWADPALGDELDDEQLREIIRSNMSGRYEDIGDAEITNMMVAAYVATGMDEADVRRLIPDASTDYVPY